MKYQGTGYNACTRTQTFWQTSAHKCKYTETLLMYARTPSHKCATHNILLLKPSLLTVFVYTVCTLVCGIVHQQMHMMGSELGFTNVWMRKQAIITKIYVLLVLSHSIYVYSCLSHFVFYLSPSGVLVFHSHYPPGGCRHGALTTPISNPLTEETHRVLSCPPTPNPPGVSACP